MEGNALFRFSVDSNSFFYCRLPQVTLRTPLKHQSGICGMRGVSCRIRLRACVRL
jgi:hypothetical protein